MERRPDGRLFVCPNVRILQIVRREACVLCNTSKHSGADFLAIVEGEDEIRMALPAQDTM
jgi:hypothetical protein